MVVSMNASHTEGRIVFVADGEANRYAMLTEDGKWWLALLMNGEQVAERQLANLRRMAACWNACSGISTEDIEAHNRPADLSWVPGIAAAVAQRDAMLAAFNELAAWGDGDVGHHMDEPHAASVARRILAKYGSVVHIAPDDTEGGGL